MKKALTIILATSLILGLFVACSSSPDEEIKNPDWLCFTAVEDNSIIELSEYYDSGSDGYHGPCLDAKIEYSVDDGATWVAYNEGMEEVTLQAGEKVYFRASSGINKSFSKSGDAYYYFSMSGKIAASGNVMSLLDASCELTDLSDPGYKYCFCKLFKDCDSLIQAPELPAVSLAENCYDSMFYSCKSLTQAPELPATNLAEACYDSMFGYCSALTQASALPATNLADSCYSFMFYYCESLTQAPELPATDLCNSCYSMMFFKCTDLSSVTVSFTDWNENLSTYNWLCNVSASGTFNCPQGLPMTIRDVYHVPEGWTVNNI